MQDCADNIHEAQQKSKLYPNKHRASEHAAKFNQPLKATRSRIEHLTILDTWLTKNGKPLPELNGATNGVKSHTDNKNCGNVGCDGTLTLNYVHEINGDLFSLKFIGNSRELVGKKFVAGCVASEITEAVMRYGE